MQLVYLSLGSNLGDRSRFLEQAISYLQKRAESVEKISSIYETEPAVKIDQPWFLNCCVEIETELRPKALLKICQEIENILGRERREKWGPRTIDIDILFYENRVNRSPHLTLPHPHLHQRRFVLQPLAQIAPDFQHPILKKTVKELLKECSDTSIVRLAHDHPPTQKTRHAIQDRHPLGRS